jgi:hypothetical protein
MAGKSGLQRVNGEVVMTCEQHAFVRKNYGNVRVFHDCDGYYIRAKSRYIYLDDELKMKKLGYVIVITKDDIIYDLFNSAMPCNFISGWGCRDTSKFLSENVSHLISLKENFEITEFNSSAHIFYYPFIYGKYFMCVKVFKNNKIFHESMHESNDTVDETIPLTFDETGSHKFDITLPHYFTKHHMIHTIGNDKYHVVIFRV